MQKVLITGGAGFIGSTLADDLLSDGYRVVCIDNLNSLYPVAIKKSNIREALTNPNYTFYKTDISNSRQVKHIFTSEKPDRVVHIAGLTGMQQSFKEPYSFYSNNVEGAVSVLEACRITGNVPLVLISTATVYGSHSTGLSEDAPLPEPVNPYAASKIMGEEAARFYHDGYNLPVTILRLYTVYGPRQRATMAISKFTGLLLANKEIPVYGDGGAVRDYLHVDDCTWAIRLAMQRATGFEVFNISSNSAESISEIINKLALIFGKTARIKYQSPISQVPEASDADISKAVRLMNYHPSVGFREGLEQFCHWYKNQAVFMKASKTALNDE